jgi:hypothetical protein
LKHHVDFVARGLVVCLAGVLILTATLTAIFGGLFANGGATSGEPFSLTAAIIVTTLWMVAISSICFATQAAFRWIDKHCC